MYKFAHLADCHIGAQKYPELKELEMKAFKMCMDRCILDANIALEVDLSELMEDPQGKVLFKEVMVEEGALRMKVLVNIDL